MHVSAASVSYTGTGCNPKRKRPKLGNRKQIVAGTGARARALAVVLVLRKGFQQAWVRTGIAPGLLFMDTMITTTVRKQTL